MDGLLTQLRKQPNEPRGWSFAKWGKGTNVSSNFREASAIMLEYPHSAFAQLKSKVEDLLWTHFWITTETKSRNTVTVVFPLTKPINDKQYARLASVLAFKIDEYGMEPGSLAAHHIVNVYETSMALVQDGPRDVLNPELLIKQTEREYQNQSARKFEGTAPTRSGVQPTTPKMVEDNLFLWPETDAERRQRELAEMEQRYGLRA
jgi:hypothetical protein